MDGLFKQKLLGLRKPTAPATFAEALFGDVTWLKAAPRSEVKAPVVKETFTEKAQVIESLERFAQEKSAELNTPVIKIPGGEVIVKPEPTGEDVGSFQDAGDLIKSLSLDPRFLDIVLKPKARGTVKAMFISEKFRPWGEAESELKDGFLNELIVGFPLKTAELFERMIAAMKLTPGEVIIFPVEGSDETDYSKEVMQVASYFNPEVIITLGAKATSRILKSNDRLSMIHGQFFSRKVGHNQSFHIVPLFHPSIIETNQNMKKTAWADMQKIMKHLKKLP